MIKHIPQHLIRLSHTSRRSSIGARRLVPSVVCAGAVTCALWGCNPKNTGAATNAASAGTVGSSQQEPGKAPPPKPPEPKSFTNTRQGLIGSLAGRFVNFSFSYPAAWKLDRDGARAGGRNFVTVQHTTPDGKLQDYFSVRDFNLPGAGSAGRDRSVIRQAAHDMNRKISHTVPTYAKISQGPARIGSYSGYELLYQARGPGNVPITGRTVFLPASTTGQANGIVINIVRGSPQSGPAGETAPGIAGGAGSENASAPSEPDGISLILHSFQMPQPPATKKTMAKPVETNKHGHRRRRRIRRPITDVAR